MCDWLEAPDSPGWWWRLHSTGEVVAQLVGELSVPYPNCKYHKADVPDPPKTSNPLAEKLRAALSWRGTCVQSNVFPIIEEVIAALESEPPDELAKAKDKIDELKMLCLHVRDAVNEYHRTKSQSSCDEVERLVGMCNRVDIAKGLPYVRSLIDYEVERIKRTLPAWHYKTTCPGRWWYPGTNITANVSAIKFAWSGPCYGPIPDPPEET